MHKYLTEDVQGIGGTIKETPGDFIVEEIPLYVPCGEGEHTYVELEKTGITTLEAIRRIARFAGAQERDLGYAGMKDAAGITRQTISVPRIPPEKFSGVELPGLRVISAKRHRNKLKLGHLSGNRFTIRICNPAEEALEKAEKVLEVLCRRGVPNYFGPQRYGAQGNYPQVGRAILLGDYRAAVDAVMGSAAAIHDEGWKRAIELYHQGDVSKSLDYLPRHCRTERDILLRLEKKPDAFDRAFHSVHPRLKKLYLSAYQSSLFDRVLDLRLPRLDTVIEGDVAFKHSNGACFIVHDADAENARAETFEISATGPMFGWKMKLPEGPSLDLERQVMTDEGLALEQFDVGGGLGMEGERRPFRVQVNEPAVRMDERSLIVTFSLPRGSYATVVLSEIMKSG